MSDYNNILKIISKKGYPIHKRESRNYCHSGYAVVTKNKIVINSHIDLEVARTIFKFNDNGKLKDIDVWGWY